MFFRVNVDFCRRKFQYISALTGSLGILSSEMHFGWPSPSLPALTNGTYKIQATNEEASWLAVTVLAGVATGAIFSAFLANALGRKRIILLTSLPFLISWLMIGLATNIELLFIARLLGGIAGGISFSTVPMYLGEISEPKIRGMLSSICPVFVVLGILLINMLGNYLPIDTTAFIASSIPVVMFLAFAFMPESPVFLLSKGEQDLAKKNLEILRGNKLGEAEFDRLLAEAKNVEGNEAKTRFVDLFLEKSNRRALVIGLGLRSIQQFCGATAITFSCKTIFKESEDLVSPNVGTIIYFTLQAVLSITSSFVVDIVGRKPMMISSLFGTIVALFALSGFSYLKYNTDIDMEGYSYVSVASLFLHIIFFSCGVRNVPLLMISEMFPTEIKSKALCFATIYYGVLAIVVTKLFYVTAETYGAYLPFAIFGVVSFFSLFFVHFYVFETKGKTLEEIQRKLRGN